MNNKYKRGFIISSLIISYYNKLKMYAVNDMEDGLEYVNVLDRIRELISVEDDEYRKLDIFEVSSYISSFDNHEEGLANERYYNKLINQIKVLEEENEYVIDKDVLLSTVIDSKIIIDTYKLVCERMDNFTNNNYEYDSDIENLVNYHKISKFYYLTSNNYIEKLALKYNFDIAKIPTLSFKYIQDEFKVNFLNNAHSTFSYYIIDSMKYLENINTNEGILNTYLSLFEISRIEVLLSYLNMKEVNAIMNIWNSYYGNKNNNDALVNVKKIIRKRKEELNNSSK